MQKDQQRRQELNDVDDASMSPRKWTFRGAGSDHEIIVQLRECTPPFGSEDSHVRFNDSKSNSRVIIPDRLQCALCKRTKLTKDFWWCRTCQKTTCSSCNLLQGHTEHRTSPWHAEELVRSLVDTVEARCTARTVRASEEEAAIKEYMREIENYFLSKLHNRLEEKNKEDRELMKAVSTSTCVALCELKQRPYSATPPAPVTANGTSTSLTQFSSLLTDDSLARLVQEISHRLLSTKEGLRKLTVTKWPRMTPPTGSPSSSPFLNGRSNESGAFTGSTVDDEDMQTLTQHFYSFAAVLPNVEPLEFAQLLEQQRDLSPRFRSRSHSGIPPRGITPTMERISSRTHSPGPLQTTANGPVKTLAIFGAVDVDGEAKKNTQIDSPTRVPVSSPPTATAFVRGEYQRRSIPNTPVTTTIQATETTTANIHVVQAVISNDRPRATPPSSISTSTQSETTPTPRNSPAKQTSPTPPESKRRYSLPNRHKMTSKETSPVDDIVDTKMDDIPKRQRQLSSPTSGKPSSMSVIAFHFGEDFLTRPIDVRPMDDDLLAVSDSCGGVYITDSRGSKIVHHIWLDGNSASSLCFVPFFTEQPRRPPLLLVSVLSKENRSIHFYETARFTLLQDVPCPIQPDIDIARSRWLGTDDRGSIFLITGDGRMSALWKYHSSSTEKPWALLKQAPDTRYQYLDVVHHMADSNSVTLLTSEGVRGAILLITVSRAATKILAEQDFTDSYGLGQYIRSPSSACVDNRGNMLILDYSNGKLWLLKAPRGNRQGGDRRLKLLTEFGAQQAMGISITPTFWQSERFVNAEQWCYVACFNKKRVHGVKYLSD